MDSPLRLIVVNTAHIQQYIFGSNRLRENIGASYLVDAVTGQWAWQSVQTAIGTPASHIPPFPESFQAQPRMEDDALAEVIYAAGGNFVVLFRDVDQAKIFGRTLSRQAHEYAPGLRLLIHNQPYIWGESLGAAMSDALNALREARSTQPENVPLAGLSVTMMCRSTALPAVIMRRLSDRAEDDPLPISAEVAAKWEASTWANDRLNNQFLSHDSPYMFPYDLDDLGRTRGESSFIAVVHADGNGMGAKVREISHNNPVPRDYITAIRSFSEHIAQASTDALKDTLAHILPDVTQRTLHIFHPSLPDHGVDFGEKDGKIVLPFRPLVFGGDDVTFVCDGRLGIGLALAYLRAFKTRTDEQGFASTAAAGVAIVKAHYPFARAYGMAEALVKSAKDYTRTELALDWHFALSGLLSDLETIRQREYTNRDGSLTLRPLTVDGKGIHDWDMIEQALDGFYQPTWANKRNKQKALHDALYRGAHAVETFLSTYRAKLPSLPIAGAGFQNNGWHDRVCGYADGLELLDLYIPLGTLEQQNS